MKLRIEPRSDDKRPPNPGMTSAPESCWLYVLECEGGSLYTGVSKDVEGRFRKHLSGKGAKYTRANRPDRQQTFCFLSRDDGRG